MDISPDMGLEPTKNVSSVTNRDVEDMRNQLLKTKIQYQKIINSGQIKDTSKIESMKKILSKLDH